jgi:phosphoribosylaminoimidazolecarboxamide formyltransferase/IMP cyclohydrolase
VEKPIALFSLNDTRQADRFAAILIEAGWEVIGSAETVRLLRGSHLPVTDISDFTGVKEDYGFPPTLHPRVEYALTHGFPRIELVYVIPYPLSKGNDVGGRALLALAVKGDRAPVTSIAAMEKVTDSIKTRGGISEELRTELRDEALWAIANHYAGLIKDRKRFDGFSGSYVHDLENGENPYQVPAMAFEMAGNSDPLSLTKFRIISGNTPCFTNMADADCILNTLCLTAGAFLRNVGSIPFICVAGKHGNACGLGISRSTPADAVSGALWGNPRSIWGGEVVTNFPIDENIGQSLLESPIREQQHGNPYWMLDIILAPSFTPRAVKALGRRKERKLLENSVLLTPSPQAKGTHYRPIRGGFLRQPPADYVLKIDECESGYGHFSETEMSALIISWAVAFSSFHGGNEIALAKADSLLSAGGGPSTVEAAKAAVARARDCGHDLKNSAFGADAFFPFTDAPRVLCEAGTTIGSVPMGGKNGQEIRKFFEDRGKKILYIPEAYRGFCRH